MSVWNTDRIYPSVNALVNVLSNADGFISSVIVFFSKFVQKKLLRKHNIKLNKLMVIKTNYANKIYIKHQKQKIKVK
jgi:hypothetical protein